MQSVLAHSELRLSSLGVVFFVPICTARIFPSMARCARDRGRVRWLVPLSLLLHLFLCTFLYFQVWSVVLTDLVESDPLGLLQSFERVVNVLWSLAHHHLSVLLLGVLPLLGRVFLYRSFSLCLGGQLREQSVLRMALSLWLSIQIVP
jgi:hypothetical protein